MFKQRYEAYQQEIKPTACLIAQTIENASSGAKPGLMIRWRKSAILAACACLCVLLAMPTLAATIEPIYQLMYFVSPAVAQFFLPVQQSDEDNGIKMEIVSASIQENQARIYLTLQDLTQDRIDATTDLSDSYTLYTAFDSTASCERVGYDDTTKTATFLITLNAWDEKTLSQEKITFSLKSFSSRKETLENILVAQTLADVGEAASTQQVKTSGGGGPGFDFATGQATVLVPGEDVLAFPSEKVKITGIGFVEGRLHVQAAFFNRQKYDTHGYFFLQDAQGNIVQDYATIYYRNPNETMDNRIDYGEYVFDISEHTAQEYALYGTFMDAGLFTEGNWRVTFSL